MEVQNETEPEINLRRLVEHRHPRARETKGHTEAQGCADRPGAEAVRLGTPGRELQRGLARCGPRHLATWAEASGPGAAFSPREAAGRAGRVRRWWWQLAGLAKRRMWRMPAACPGMSPSGSKCLVGGRSRQAALGHPLTPAVL